MIHRMLVGTYTSGVERDYIGIMDVQLPKDDMVIDARKFDEERNGSDCLANDSSFFLCRIWWIWCIGTSTNQHETKDSS